MKKIYLFALIGFLVVIGIGMVYLIFNNDNLFQNESINKNTSEKNNISGLNNNVSSDIKNKEVDVEYDKIMKDTNYGRENNIKNAKLSEKQVIAVADYYLKDLDSAYEVKYIKKYDSNNKIWYVAYGKHNNKKYQGVILIDDETGKTAIV